MRAQTAGALLLLGGFVSLWVGCGRRPTPPRFLINLDRLPAGGACERDTDCRSGFCDRDVCNDVFEGRVRGGECEPESAVDGPREVRLDRGCGGYLCMDGRCRSCQSDVECQAYFGDARCSRSRKMCLNGNRKER